MELNLDPNVLGVIIGAFSQVIIVSPYVGISFMKLSMYKQMCGRAGRMGFTNAGESYLLCQDADMPKVMSTLV